MIVHSSENFYGAAGSTDMAGPQSYLASEADRLWVAVYDGFLELPDTCRTSVVYVSSNQSLSIHTYNISMAEKSFGKRRTLLHRVVSVINMHPISQPLVW